uniref:Choline transporter-like protein 2 n=1 Tax=Ditylenchus dipsaci TaxID=166011 RepID=A0A915EMV5_9BILA
MVHKRGLTVLGRTRPHIQPTAPPATNDYFGSASTSCPIYEQIDEVNPGLPSSSHPLSTRAVDCQLPLYPYLPSAKISSAPPLPPHYSCLPSPIGQISNSSSTTRASNSGSYLSSPNTSFLSTCSSEKSIRPETAPPSEIVGRNAARFELRTPKFSRKAAGKRPFNPIVLTHRGCTDVCCCMLFSVFLLGWAAVAFLAVMWGKPERLIHPTDNLGRICGHDRPGAYNLSSKPYLLFFDLTKCVSYATVLTGCPTPQVCVETCPNSYFSYLQLQGLSQADFRIQLKMKMVCIENVDKNRVANFEELKQYVDQGSCAAYTVNSAAVLGRCLPQVFLEAEKVVVQTYNTIHGPFGSRTRNSTKVLDGIVNGRAVIQKIAADLSVCWWQILGLLAMSAAVSFLWTVVMRILGGAMIWLSILLLLVVLVGGSGYCWYKYKLLHDAGAVNDFSFQPVLTIGLSGMFVIVLLIFLFVRSRIKIAVALIEQASKALGHMLSTVFFPVVPFVLHIAVFAIWGSITIWLASSGEENCRRPRLNDPLLANNDIRNGDPCNCVHLGTSVDPMCRFVNVTRDNTRLLAMQAYNLFGCFWLSCFVSALSDMTLAGAFASHYFAFRKPRDVPSFPVLRALGRAIRYHIGTLAFGSLILSVVKFFQVILDFAYSRLKGVENPIGRFLYRALSCFFFCLETFLRFLTTNAYIMTAIYGKGFCRSSRDSFSLLARNIIRVVVVSRTAGFLLFVGKALITIGMGAVAHYYFNGIWVINGLPQITLYYHFLPVVIVLLGTYLICDLFFEVYEMGVDTTFLCFLEDSETNDGSPEKPFYMSDELKKYWLYLQLAKFICLFCY